MQVIRLCREAGLIKLGHVAFDGTKLKANATGRQQHGASSPPTKRRARGKWTVQMRRKLARGGSRSRYRLRKQIVEPVFGQIKSVLGFARLLLRAVVNVAHGWALVCMAHNLRKLFLGGLRCLWAGSATR